MTDFPWVPLYRELAGKLLSFEERQGELIRIQRELRESGLKVIALDDKDDKGRTVPLAVIDPFSFIASFKPGHHSRATPADHWRAQATILASECGS